MKIHSIVRYKIVQLSHLLIFIAFSFMGCAVANQAYSPTKKYSPEQLKEDFNVVWKTYQRNHPSLYWYNPKDTVDHYFNMLYNNLTDSLTELEFRNKLAMAIEKIKCGHTSVRLSKAFAKYSVKQKNEIVFPLSMKTWGGDSLIITKNAFRKDSQLVRGTIIKSINGKSVKNIIGEMAAMISTDGFNNNFKYQLISNNFPTYYHLTFGLSSYYEIEYVSLDGNTKTKQIFNYDPKADTTEKRNIKKPKAAVLSKRQMRNYELLNNRSMIIDTANHLAYMQLNTFSKNKLAKFFRQSFHKLKEENIPNLVIELRENGGGSINNSTTLTRYMIDHPFRVADTVAAISFKYPYPKQMKNGFWYKLEHFLVSSRKRKDGKYHFNQLETKVHKPIEKNHYNGHIYLITGGYTFSASTLFIHQLKGQKNVTIVGEETGGGAYGSTATNIPDIILPNTGIRARLPLYRLVLNKDLPHNGRGIIPDVDVPPGSIFLKNGVDPKMEKVKELIKQKMNSKN